METPDRTGRSAFFGSVAALVVPVVLVIFPVTWHNVKYDHPEGRWSPPTGGWLSKWRRVDRISCFHALGW